MTSIYAVADRYANDTGNRMHQLDLPQFLSTRPVQSADLSFFGSLKQLRKCPFDTNWDSKYSSLQVAVLRWEQLPTMWKPVNKGEGSRVNAPIHHRWETFEEVGSEEQLRGLQGR
ncbi:unnamed protein product [Calypogeia fissa]